METVRDGRLVWPYCKECGCRLDIRNDGPKYMLLHFKGKVIYEETSIIWHSDARGCECSLMADFWIVEKDRLDYIGV